MSQDRNKAPLMRQNDATENESDSEGTVENGKDDDYIKSRRAAMDNHCEIERRRRNKMVRLTRELSSILVPHHHHCKPDKLSVLKMAADSIKQFQDSTGCKQFLNDEERKKLILKTCPGFLFIVLLDTWHLLYISPNVLDILGRPQMDWHEEDSFLSSIHPGDHSFIKELLNNNNKNNNNNINNNSDSNNRRKDSYHGNNHSNKNNNRNDDNINNKNGKYSGDDDDTSFNNANKFCDRNKDICKRLAFSLKFRLSPCMRDRDYIIIRETRKRSDGEEGGGTYGGNAKENFEREVKRGFEGGSKEGFEGELRGGGDGVLRGGGEKSCGVSYQGDGKECRRGVVDTGFLSDARDGVSEEVSGNVFNESKRKDYGGDETKGDDALEEDLYAVINVTGYVKQWPVKADMTSSSSSPPSSSSSSCFVASTLVSTPVTAFPFEASSSSTSVSSSTPHARCAPPINACSDGSSNYSRDGGTCFVGIGQPARTNQTSQDKHRGGASGLQSFFSAKHDLEGRFTFVDSNVTEVLAGVKTTDLLGVKLSQLCSSSAADVSVVDEAFAQLISQKQQLVAFTIHFQRPTALSSSTTTTTTAFPTSQSNPTFPPSTPSPFPVKLRVSCSSFINPFTASVQHIICQYSRLSEQYDTTAVTKISSSSAPSTSSSSTASSTSSSTSSSSASSSSTKSYHRSYSIRNNSVKDDNIANKNNNKNNNNFGNNTSNFKSPQKRNYNITQNIATGKNNTYSDVKSNNNKNNNNNIIDNNNNNIICNDTINKLYINDNRNNINFYNPSNPDPTDFNNNIATTNHHDYTNSGAMYVDSHPQLQNHPYPPNPFQGHYPTQAFSTPPSLPFTPYSPSIQYFYQPSNPLPVPPLNSNISLNNPPYCPSRNYPSSDFQHQLYQNFTHDGSFQPHYQPPHLQLPNYSPSQPYNQPSQLMQQPQFNTPDPANQFNQSPSFSANSFANQNQLLPNHPGNFYPQPPAYVPLSQHNPISSSPQNHPYPFPAPIPPSQSTELTDDQFLWMNM